MVTGYLGRLVANDRIAGYLEQYHKDILSELVQIIEQQATAA